MYLTLPPGRAIRTGTSRLERLALLTFLRCKVWPCRRNRRHVLCILIERYFHEVQVVETECDQALHSSPKQYQRQQQYTQQNEQRCFIRTQRNNISITYATISLHSVLSAISVHIPLSQFQPLKSTQILHYKYFRLHFNSTSKFSQDSFQQILYIRVCKLLSFPTWRYFQPTVAFKLLLFYKY
jgi:hypothetical protein